MTGIAAETGAPRSRRRRPLSLRRVARGSVPYLLVVPVLVVIGAVLGYPLYKLVTLSFQQYGLPELIQRQRSGMGQVRDGELLGRPHVQHQDLAGGGPLQDRLAIDAPQILAVCDEVGQRHLQLDQAFLGFRAQAHPSGRTRARTRVAR